MKQFLGITTFVATSAAASLAFAQQPAPDQFQQPQPQQQQPSPYGNMHPFGYHAARQAGGLAPPPPMQPATTTPGATTPTQEQLDEAKKKDSGRGLEWFYLNAEGGFEQLGLKTFNIDRDNFTAGFVDTSASGGVIGAGIGARLVFLTLGARGRLGFFPKYQLYSLGAELGIHIPLGPVEPHIDFGGGWIGLGNFNADVTGAGDALAIHGWYGRVTGGLDFYVTNFFSLGGAVSWELLGLTRPGATPDQIAKIKAEAPTDQQRAAADLLKFDGTSYGAAFALTGVAGLHF